MKPPALGSFQRVRRVRKAPVAGARVAGLQPGPQKSGGSPGDLDREEAFLAPGALGSGQVVLCGQVVKWSEENHGEIWVFPIFKKPPNMNHMNIEATFLFLFFDGPIEDPGVRVGMKKFSWN